MPIGDETSRGPFSGKILPYIVAATFFMEYLDTTIIATALPQMAKSFHVGPNEVSLGMTAYMLTMAVFIPVSGWIADRYGSRTVFAAAVVNFAVASASCGFSNGVASFTGSRVLQGIGGAMMVPVGRLVVVRNTEKNQMMKAIATITWPGVVAPVLGPSIGGFITTYASWHWIFFVNIPLSIAALIAILSFVPNQRAESRHALDLAGFVLTGLALVFILYGTELASRQAASLVNAGLFILAGIGCGIAAVGHARRTAHPLLDFSSLKISTFAVTIFSGSLSRIGIEAVPYLTPLLFQVGFGLSPFQSGLLLLASASGNLGMKAFTTPILNGFGFRDAAIWNIGIASVIIAACGWLSPGTMLPVILGVLLIYGLARSLQFTSLATLAYADVSDAQKGAASTLWSVAQQATLGMGIAFGALSLRAAAAVCPDSPGKSLSLMDFRIAFAMAGMLTLFSGIGYLRLPRDAGAGINQRRFQSAK
jgi:EmrB/QacA subfamily drug resistance transporter